MTLYQGIVNTLFAFELASETPNPVPPPVAAIQISLPVNSGRRAGPDNANWEQRARSRAPHQASPFRTPGGGSCGPERP